MAGGRWQVRHIQVAADWRLLLIDRGNTYGAAVSYRYQSGTNRLERTEVNLNYTYDWSGM